MRLVLSRLLLTPSAQHFITPTWCEQAALCNHTGIPECAQDIITEQNSKIKVFLDECDIFEYNCDNRKEYNKVDMVNCQKISTTTSSTRQSTININFIRMKNYLRNPNQIMSMTIGTLFPHTKTKSTKRNTIRTLITHSTATRRPPDTLLTTSPKSTPNISVPTTQNYIRDFVRTLGSTLSSTSTSSMSKISHPTTTNCTRNPSRTLTTTTTVTLPPPNALSSTSTEFVPKTSLPTTTNCTRTPSQTMTTTTTVTFPSPSTLSSTSTESVPKISLSTTTNCTRTPSQTMTTSTTVIHPPPNTLSSTSTESVPKTSLPTTTNCTRTPSQIMTTTTTLTFPSPSTLSSPSTESVPKTSLPTTRNCTRKPTQTLKTTTIATLLPPNTLSSTITESESKTTKDCTRNPSDALTTNTDANSLPHSTLLLTSTKSVSKTSLPTTKDCTRNPIENSTTITTASLPPHHTLSSSTISVTDTPKGTKLESTNFTHPLITNHLNTTPQCTCHENLSNSPNTVSPLTTPTSSSKTTMTSLTDSTLPLPSSIMDISTLFTTVIETTKLQENVSHFDSNCTRPQQIRSNGCHCMDHTKITNPMTTSMTSPSSLTPFSSTPKIPTSVHSTVTMTSTFTITTNKTQPFSESTISTHHICTHNHNNTISTKTTLPCQHQLSTTEQVTKPMTTIDTTKAVVQCENYPQNCKRPFTWETTAQDETRDFFQILRARFGTRVRLLRATTHFPIRAPFFIHK